MAYGIILIIGVIVISGIIAYLGDQIGMKVGKKRISLFGLRPKYTSIIITVLTGVLIASLTVTAILATNNGVRQAIFNIHDVLSTLNTVTNELDEVNFELEEVSQQLVLRDIELNEMQDKIIDREEELTVLQETKEELEEENNSLERQRDELEKQRDSLESRLKGLQSELASAQDNIDGLQETRDHLLDQVEELNDTIDQLNEERYALEDEIEQLNQELDMTTMYYYTWDLVYQRGETIYSDIIEKADTQNLRDSIADFIWNANEEVLQHPVKIDPETDMAISLRPEEILALSTRMEESDSQRFIVSLTSDTNVSQDGYVYGRFILEESFVVFEEGEMINSIDVNANSSVLELQKELTTLLENLNSVAVRNGILTNDEGEIGAIEYSRFVQISEEIQSMEGQVELRVVANQDIWREDGLNQQFSSKLSFETVEIGD